MKFKSTGTGGEWRLAETPRPLLENPRQRLESVNKIRAQDSVWRKQSPRLHFAKI